MSQISSVPSGAGQTPLTFNYWHNDANQRVNVSLADGSYWTYEYDSLGQVTSGKRYWSDGTPVAGQQFEYAFDDIGNRTSTKAGGDSVGGNLRSATYGANTLNQYTNRTVSGTFDVLGIAHAAATTTVNSASTYRKGEYFHKAVSVDNSTGAVYLAVTVQASATNGTDTTTGNVFLPKTAETFTYDADGNLTSDGRWTNRWDAENRLIEMQPLSGIPSGAKNDLKFTYDCQGRRISKTASNWTGSAWSLSYDNRFVYDGWNPVAEVNSSNLANVCSYMWGLDLSGSLQGAGGVGGLLGLSPGNAAYLVACDGNGNVAGLVNASTGTNSAQYEYGPFGETIRLSGGTAALNAFSFSTKYHDPESDLNGYGHRDYSASFGRWLSRDPVEERGGRNLYCLLGNNAIDDADALGMVKLADIEAERRKLDSSVRRIKCCCKDRQVVAVKANIAGTSSGQNITQRVTLTKEGGGWYGGCRELVQVVKYYWWDCFTAQNDYDKDTSRSRPTGRDAFQEYGWHEGGAVQLQSAKGRGPNFDFYDSNKRNWQAAVLYTFCGIDKHYHAKVALSNLEEWTWDPKSKSWTSPHDGYYADPPLQTPPRRPWPEP